MASHLPANSAVQNTDIIRSVQTGFLDAGIVPLTLLSTVLPEFALFDLPFLFENSDALERFQTGGGGATMLETARREGVVPLGFINAGFVQMSASRAIVLPADVAGLKMTGSITPTFATLYEALDAFPINLAFSERFTALETGIIDGQESSFSLARDFEFAEVQDFFTETNHRADGYVLIVREDFWSGLDPDVRTILNDVFIGTLAELNTSASNLDAGARDDLIEAGVTVRTLDSSERAAWIEAVQPVWLTVEDTIGVDLINSALDANEAD